MGPGPIRRFLLPGLFIIALFVALVVRQPKAKIWKVEGQIFGTTYLVKALPGDSTIGPETLKEEIDAKLTAIDLVMSTYKESSELSKFNKAKTTETTTISKELAEVLQESLTVTTITQGAFDVTVGPLVNLWGFGPDKSLKEPSTEALAKAKTQVGTDKLLLSTDDLTLQKKHPELFIDLSAIAKGYAVDQVGLLLEKHGLESYLVEIGGEIRARGRNLNGAVWHLGIEKPHILPTREVALVVPLDDLSMATTGNYRNYYLREDGRKVSHAIDARTAEPVESPFSSVTVLHKDCMRADALATGFFALGREDGLKIAEEHKLAVLYVEPAGESYEVFASSTFPMFHTK